MKKSIKNTLLAVLLSSCAAVASAVPLSGTFYVPPTDMWGTMQSFNFGAGDSTVMAGDTFVYDFLMNTPPPAAWFNITVSADHPGDVMFSDAALYTMGDPMSPAPNFTVNTSAESITGNGFVDSGLYAFEVSGTFMAAGAGFTGTGIAGVADVPEPMTVSLMGLGLAGIAGLRRRHAAKAAKAA